jgi:hypothetical protein
MQSNSHSYTSKSLVAWPLVLLCAMAVGVPLRSGARQARAQETPRSPFSLAIVPGVGGITMAKAKPREFYVVITNVSARPQSIWQYRNSWGYRAISFQLTTKDGRNFVLSRKQEAFTINFPSTFVIESGEHQVYPIRLDEGWGTNPEFPKSDETPVALKAIYEVAPTPEAKEHNVWVGRVESHGYDFSLRQW